MNLLSILIAEDGRGLALSDVVGGSILDAYWSRSLSPLSRGLQRAGLPVGIKMNKSLIS